MKFGSFICSFINMYGHHRGKVGHTQACIVIPVLLDLLASVEPAPMAQESLSTSAAAPSISVEAWEQACMEVPPWAEA